MKIPCALRFLVALLASVVLARTAHPFLCTDSAGNKAPVVSDHEHFKTINQIQLLDLPGDPAKGEILH